MTRSRPNWTLRGFALIAIAGASILTSCQQRAAQEHIPLDSALRYTAENNTTEKDHIAKIAKELGEGKLVSVQQANELIQLTDNIAGAFYKYDARADSLSSLQTTARRAVAFSTDAAKFAEEIEKVTTHGPDFLSTWTIGVLDPLHINAQLNLVDPYHYGFQYKFVEESARMLYLALENFFQSAPALQLRQSNPQIYRKIEIVQNDAARLWDFGKNHYD